LVTWIVAAVGLQAVAAGAFRLSAGPAGPVGLLGAAFPVQAPVPEAVPASPPAILEVEPMASVRGLTLVVPGIRVKAVAYHEASRARAIALRPRGRCARNANRTKFTPPHATEGPAYLVMSSRGRPHPATSAVDVAMRKGTSVLAPVSGKIVTVKQYDLYGRYRDVKIVIRPSHADHLLVTMIHLDRLQVRKGDVVTAGQSPIGVPRVFPFNSQVNDYIGGGIPHVHIEVKERGA
jgi:hypothetical protein